MIKPLLKIIFIFLPKNDLRNIKSIVYLQPIFYGDFTQRSPPH